MKDSREEDAYRIARQKLHLIASTLVERDRFEEVFSRIMCLIPPEELQSILINASPAPCNDEEQERIARMVQQGFKAWTAFHERFNQQQQLMRQQDPGLVIWDDVLHFVSHFAGAQHAAQRGSHPFPHTSNAESRPSCAGGLPQWRYARLTPTTGSNICFSLRFSSPPFSRACMLRLNG